MFINLNYIIKYLYVSYLMRKIIFHLFFILVLIKLTTFFKFKFINYRVFLKRFLILFNKNNEYLFFNINAFILL